MSTTPARCTNKKQRKINRGLNWIRCSASASFFLYGRTMCNCALRLCNDASARIANNKQGNDELVVEYKSTIRRHPRTPPELSTHYYTGRSIITPVLNIKLLISFIFHWIIRWTSYRNYNQIEFPIVSSKNDLIYIHHINTYNDLLSSDPTYFF